MIITAIIAVFGKLLVSGRPRYIIERRPDTAPRTRSLAHSLPYEIPCVCVHNGVDEGKHRPSFRVHTTYTRMYARICTRATTVSRTLRVRRRATLTPPYGNTAIYPAEVYTRVAAVNSRPGTGNVIVRDPIA